MAGLSFTLALRQLWPADLEPRKIIICERDSKNLPPGREGYSLSLAGYDETGGLFAARDLGLLDKILAQAMPGLGDQFTFTIWDSSWSEILNMKFKPAPGLPTAGIRLARKSLRKVLIDAVGPDQIRWGVACVAAETLPGGRVRVKLSGDNLQANQLTEHCDLLIVADGASSKIRANLRPHDTLQYTELMQKGGRAFFPNGLPKPIDKSWGMLLSSGKGMACFLSPYDATSVAWGISYRSSTIEPPLNSDNYEDAQSILEDCRLLGKDFPEPFHTIINATDPRDMARLPARDRQPFSHDLATGPVLFIGDSNHAVSPFSGYGASLALKDGLDLASQLCKAKSLGEAVKAYDAVSMPRAAKILKESHRRINMAHATGLNYWFFRVFLGVGGLFLSMTGNS